MITASEVITDVRDVLADTGGTRYSDALLLRLLNEAVRNFVISTRFLKQKAFIAIEQGITVYNMSAYAITIDRVQYLNKALEVKTEEEMDIINPDWELEVGLEPKYVIFDNLQAGTFKIYPKVFETAADIITQNQAYGGLIDITITDDLLYLPGITNIAFNAVKYLAVYYIEAPATITQLTDTIKLNKVWIPALVAYVSGQALRLDSDAQSRQFGAEQLSIYDRYVSRAKAQDANINNTMSIPNTGYKGFI